MPLAANEVDGVATIDASVSSTVCQSLDRSREPCDETAECVPGSVCFDEHCVGAGNLRMSLAFSVDSDFDLDRETPRGAEIFFFNDSADGGGTLDVDQCVVPCGSEPHPRTLRSMAACCPASTRSGWRTSADEATFRSRSRVTHRGLFRLLAGDGRRHLRGNLLFAR